RCRFEAIATRPGRCLSRIETGVQGFIHDLLERLPEAMSDLLQISRETLVDCESDSHAGIKCSSSLPDPELPPQDPHIETRLRLLMHLAVLHLLQQQRELFAP